MPQARLVRLEHSKRLLLTDGFLSKTGEYYLERNVRVAEHVVDYFLTGKMMDAGGGVSDQ